MYYIIDIILKKYFFIIRFYTYYNYYSYYLIIFYSILYYKIIVVIFYNVDKEHSSVSGAEKCQTKAKAVPWPQLALVHRDASATHDRSQLPLSRKFAETEEIHSSQDCSQHLGNLGQRCAFADLFRLLNLYSYPTQCPLF